MNASRYNPTLHRIALLTAAATLPLIAMGGLVTSHQAGMSVPDWPNSYGYNMFLFPPRLWIGGILYEHTHRLMATVVGMLAILLTGWAWMTASRPRVRWLATSVLAAVILQGVLGGLRVVWVKLDLAIVHACVAQAFFCLAASMAVVTSRWWLETPVAAESMRGQWLWKAAAVTVLIVYLQLIAGALMRHHQAGLAIPDVPLAYGKLLPPTTQAGLDAVNSTRVRDLDLDRVTLGQVWLHFAHRIGALLVTTVIAALSIHIFRRHRHERKLVRPAIWLCLLLLAQLSLGVATVWFRKPADVASAHVAVGALVLVTSFVLAVRAARLYGPLAKKTPQRGFTVAATTSGNLVPA